MASLKPILKAIMKLINRLFNEPDESYFLLGPRGTGKSTVIKQRHPTALWVDLLLPQIFRSYLARPERLFELVNASVDKNTVIIDEVQKAPSLLSVVHSIIEEKRQFKFVLTGSSARKLKRVSANLLGGRALKLVMHPFIALELGDQFSIDRSLKYGLLPIILSSTDPAASLQAYLQLYLQEEIQAEGLVRNLEDFSRFLEAISFSHAAVLNVANIARECEVKRKTVENYIGVLIDLLLAYEITIFSKRAKRKLVSHNKFYLFDCGVFRALRPSGPLDRKEEIEGAALEGLVAQNLRAWIDYSKEKMSIHYWRTPSGLEVDFIIYGENFFWAIEVKNSQRVHETDTKALQEFLKDYPTAKAFLLYRGNEQLNIKNILCMPVEKFLKNLPWPN
jgi:predicted AAA+ superfamily ATPase